MFFLLAVILSTIGPIDSATACRGARESLPIYREYADILKLNSEYPNNYNKFDTSQARAEVENYEKTFMRYLDACKDPDMRANITWKWNQLKAEIAQFKKS
jgi:hypothetical protein